jgi:hypothetical protein
MRLLLAAMLASIVSPASAAVVIGQPNDPGTYDKCAVYPEFCDDIEEQFGDPLAFLAQTAQQQIDQIAAFLQQLHGQDAQIIVTRDPNKSGAFTYSVSSGGNITRSGTLTVGSVAAVPEPGTWLLLLAGFGMIGFTLRGRRSEPSGSVPLCRTSGI